MYANQYNTILTVDTVHTFVKPFSKQINDNLSFEATF